MDNSENSTEILLFCVDVVLKSNKLHFFILYGNKFCITL